MRSESDDDFDDAVEVLIRKTRSEADTGGWNVLQRIPMMSAYKRLGFKVCPPLKNVHQRVGIMMRLHAGETKCQHAAFTSIVIS